MQYSKDYDVSLVYVMMNNYRHYVVEQRSLWGDYGDVLLSGFADRGFPNGPLLLQRVGPFLPPISFPYSSVEGSRIVLSGHLIKLIENRFDLEFDFGKVVYAKIVNIDIQDWDFSSAQPNFFPENGDPVNYIKGFDHDAMMATMMPESGELLRPVFEFRLTRLKLPDGRYSNIFKTKEPSIVAEIPPMFINNDIFGYLVVNSEMKDFLDLHVNHWVNFQPILMEE